MPEKAVAPEISSEPRRWRSAPAGSSRPQTDRRRCPVPRPVQSPPGAAATASFPATAPRLDGSATPGRPPTDRVDERKSHQVVPLLTQVVQRAGESGLRCPRGSDGARCLAASDGVPLGEVGSSRALLGGGDIFQRCRGSVKGGGVISSTALAAAAAHGAGPRLAMAMPGHAGFFGRWRRSLAMGVGPVPLRLRLLTVVAGEGWRQVRRRWAPRANPCSMPWVTRPARRRQRRRLVSFSSSPSTAAPRLAIARLKPGASSRHAGRQQSSMRSTVGSPQPSWCCRIPPQDE